MPSGAMQRSAIHTPLRSTPHLVLPAPKLPIDQYSTPLIYPHSPPLFCAQVCWRSGKVQLNSGIIERRYQNWEKAEAHFRLARVSPQAFVGGPPQVVQPTVGCGGKHAFKQQGCCMFQ